MTSAHECKIRPILQLPPKNDVYRKTSSLYFSMVYKHHALKFAGNTKGYDICFNDKLKNKQIMARRLICSIRATGSI